MDIIKLAKDKGYTILDLSKMMGVRVQAIYFWNRGRCQPNLKHTLKLSQILGLDTGSFIQGVLDKCTKSSEC